MSYNKFQLRSLIDRVTTRIGLASLDATNQLLGTCAKESDFGTYLRQLGSGPALGAFQMEPDTFEDLVHRFGEKFKLLYGFIFEELEWNLKAAIVMARIKYYSCPGPIPSDLDGQAHYWKQWYNTPGGKGTIDEYLTAWKRYVA